MAEYGMPKPKVLNTIASYQKRLDEAGADSAPAVPPVEDATPEPVRKPITAAEATANQAAREAKYAAEEKAAKGMPKPGMMDRLKKLITGG